MEEADIVYKVTELNVEIKNLLKSAFNNIWVEGEVSGFKKSSSEHFYFDLKDENSLISCVLFKWSAQKDLNIDNGTLVKVLADISTFDKQSKYQLIVKKVIPITVGKLQIEFEKLKKKLESEGLFDNSRKKKIPPFPKNVGVITSLYGAAVKDIISIIKRRAPHINIIIYPVKVQGEGAKEEISKAITEINEKMPQIEVLLVGRGGGSMEDLWAFNEEMVARAIANSKIPVISCVGHQTDFTIADFVADLRAPTPSAAAEIVAKNAEDLITHIKQIEKRLLSALKIIYHRIFQRFSVFINSRIYKNTFSLMENKVLSLDNLYERMIKATRDKISFFLNKLENLNGRLKNLDPKIPTKKGYAIATIKNKTVKKSSQLKEGDEIKLIFSEGSADADIKKIYD